VRRLRFIRHARELGFEVDAIRQLLALSDDPHRPCHEADVIARAHLADIEHKIARLTALRTEVRRMIDQCAQGEVKDCRVIAVLADHGKCRHGRH
jgi:DNA-binding transcriptional MerR regulator